MNSNTQDERTKNSSFDVWTVFSILHCHRYSIVGFAVLIAGITGTINKFFIDSYYISRTVIMTELDRPQGARGTIENFIGGSSGALGQIIASSSSNMELSQYERLIKSERLAIAVLNNIGLDRWLRASSTDSPEMHLAKGINKLQGKLRTRSDRVALTLELEHTDPVLATETLRAYLTELQNFLQTTSVTRARATLDFTQGRLNEAVESLRNAELRFSDLQKRAGVIQLPAQTTMALNTAAQLRARIIEKDLEIDLYTNILRDESQLNRLRSERQRLQAQLDKVLGNTEGKPSSKGKDLLTPLAKIPDLQVSFADAQREYLIQENVVELLRQQVELLRIDSKRNDPMFQVVDEPRVPVFRAGPNTLQNTLVAFGAALIFIIVFVLLLEQLRNEVRLPKPLLRILKNNQSNQFRKTG